MTVLNIAGVTLEENRDRLKIVLPVRRQWVYLGIYSLLLLVWLGMVVFGIIFTNRIAFSGERFAFVFTLLLLVFLFVLYRLGRIIWRQWQFYVANREILFLFDDHLVIRRPVSLLGITTAYDRQYVRPFRYDESQHSPIFEYGNRYVLFGLGLPRPDAEALVRFLNGRYFPNMAEE
jgi:signal transduction histidine kinase